MPTYAVQWGEGRKQAFLDWIHHELTNTIGDRAPLETAWENAIIAWRAKLSDADLDFPYPGAANYEMPLIAIHSDPVLADLIQSLHASEDYWSATARRRDTVDSASAMRRAMTAIEKRFLKMRRVNTKAFLENVVFGSAVYKNWWKSERRGRRNPSNPEQRLITEISEPCVTHIPLQRFFFPAYAWSLDFDAEGGAPWKAEEHRYDRKDFDTLRRGSSTLPGWDDDAAEAVATHFVDEDEKVRRQTQIDDKNQPFKSEHVKIYEIWARFDVKGDEVYEDIACWVHLDGPWMLRAIYMPSSHGRDPTHMTSYLPGFGVYGIGMAELDAWAQEATTDLLNAQIDNARLANTRMFKAPMGASFQQNAGVYPGKVWYIGPEEDVGEVKLSEIYPSGFALLQNLMQFAELRSGVSELRQGNLSGLPSRTPATSLLSILREGNKRFDMVHSGIRDVHSEMGLRLAQNVAQYAQADPIRWARFFEDAIGAEDAQKVMQVLLVPNVDEIEEAFGISVTATSAQVNKEVEKQSFIGMLQISQQIYQALVQTAMLMAQVPDQLVQETAKAAFASGVDILAQLFERFDVKNPQEHLGNLEAISSAMLSQGAMGNAAMPTGMALQPQNPYGMQGAPMVADPMMIAQMLGMR